MKTRMISLLCSIIMAAVTGCSGLSGYWRGDLAVYHNGQKVGQMPVAPRFDRNDFLDELNYDDSRLRIDATSRETVKRVLQTLIYFGCAGDECWPITGEDVIVAPWGNFTIEVLRSKVRPGSFLYEVTTTGVLEANILIEGHVNLFGELVFGMEVSPRPGPDKFEFKGTFTRKS